MFYNLDNNLWYNNNNNFQNKFLKFIDDEEINNYLINKNICFYDIKLSDYNFDILGDLINFNIDDKILDITFKESFDYNLSFYCIRRSLEIINKNIKYYYFI